MGKISFIGILEDESYLLEYDELNFKAARKNQSNEIQRIIEKYNFTEKPNDSAIGNTYKGKKIIKVYSP